MNAESKESYEILESCRKLRKVAENAKSCGKLREIEKVAENGKSCGTATKLCP